MNEKEMLGSVGTITAEASLESMAKSRSEPHPALGSGYAWTVFILAASLFFVEYFARISPSVMWLDLMRDFHVEAFALGSLSACFYYPYILMQVPVGMLLDKIGARFLLTFTGLCCAASCVLFGSAQSYEYAALSRVLLGFSAAFAFVGVLKLATNWFPPSRIGLLAGLTQGSGMLGASVSDGPMSIVTDHLGWRKTMMVIAVIYAALAILIGLVIRNEPKHKFVDVDEPDLKHASLSMIAGLKAVLRNPQSWWNALYAGCVFAPTGAFAELWGVAFLQYGYGFSKTVAATGIGCIFIGWAVGGPVVGWISDRIKKRLVVMVISALLCLIVMTAIIYGTSIFSQFWVYVLLFSFGACNAGVGISYAMSTEINGTKLAGTSLAFANMASVIIGAFCQPLIGKLLDLSWDHTMKNGAPVYTAADFHSALWLLPAVLIVGVLSCFFIKETNCQQ